MLMLAVVVGIAGVVTFAVQADQHRKTAEQRLSDLTDAQKRESVANYRDRFRGAFHEWEIARVDNARRLLDACPVELRGWEWRYVARLCRSELLSVGDSMTGIHPVACSQSLRFVVIKEKGAGRSRFVTHAVESRACLNDWEGIADHVAVGDQLTVFAAGENLVFRETESGRERRIVKHNHFDLSGTAAVSVSTISRDERLVATGDDAGTIRIWNADGECLHSICGHSGSVKSLAFSGDGRRLASAGNDRSALLWNVESGSLCGEFRGHRRDLLRTVAVSMDGKRIAAASLGDNREPLKNEVVVWDADSGAEQLRIVAHPVGINSISFSRDGQKLATASSDNTVQIWDSRPDAVSRTTEPIFVIRGLRLFHQVVFGDDGKRLATLESGGLFRVWDAERGQGPKRWTHAEYLLGLALDRDGRQIAAGDGIGGVFIVDRETGQRNVTLPPHADDNLVTSIAFSPDATQLASAARDGRVCFHDLKNAKLRLAATPHERWTECVAFHPDGKWIAVIGFDGTIKLLDFETGCEIRSVSRLPSAARRATFSPDGRCLAVGFMDGRVRLIDATTGEIVRAIECSEREITCLAFAHDGKQLAAGTFTSEGSEIRIGNPATGTIVATYKGHKNKVNAVAFHPDGRRLASASDDRTVRVWNTADGEELLMLTEHFGGVEGVAFTPDGRSLISGGRDCQVIIRDALD
jgi:WD40 repeat protein